MGAEPVPHSESIFRYLYRVGLMTRDLGKAIESPRRYSLSNFPRSITWGEVEQMLGKVDRRSAVGKRDYAILLLLVTYELRGREVAALTLILGNVKRLRKRISNSGHKKGSPFSSKRTIWEKDCLAHHSIRAELRLIVFYDYRDV